MAKDMLIAKITLGDCGLEALQHALNQEGFMLAIQITAARSATRREGMSGIEETRAAEAKARNILADWRKAHEAQAAEREVKAHHWDMEISANPTKTFPPDDDSAVLVWLPAGEEPKPTDWNLWGEAQPEPWWELRDAIKHAASTMPLRPDGKRPWIKTGQIIMTPERIAAVWSNRSRAQ